MLLVVNRGGRGVGVCAGVGVDDVVVLVVVFIVGIIRNKHRDSKGRNHHNKKYATKTVVHSHPKTEIAVVEKRRIATSPPR